MTHIHPHSSLLYFLLHNDPEDPEGPGTQIVGFQVPKLQKPEPLRRKFRA